MLDDELIHNPEDYLEEALAELAAGVSLETIVARAGDAAEWLAPLLEVSVDLEALQQDIPVPPPDASLQRLLAHGEALANTALPAEPAQPWWSIFRPIGSYGTVALNRGLAASVLAAGLLMFCLVGGLFGAGLTLAAEDSLPGQSLYSIKRLGERARLLLADDAINRQRLLDTFNNRRLDEVHRLLETNLQAEVVFTGRVEWLSASEVSFGAFTAKITPETTIEGPLAVGAQVQVTGITQDAGLLTVLTITVVEVAPPAPTSTATPSPTQPSSPTPVAPTTTKKPVSESTSDTIDLPPTATPTATQESVNESTSDTITLPPTATPTATLKKPSPTVFPTSGATDDTNDTQPVVTVTRTPTLAPSPTPFAPPTDLPNDNGNDNSDDNANDNDVDHGNDNSDDDSNDNGDDNSGSSGNGNSGSGGGDDDRSGKGGGDDDDSDKSDDDDDDD